MTNAAAPASGAGDTRGAEAPRASATPPGGRRGIGAWARRIALGTLLLAVVCVIVLAAGFLTFTARIADREQPPAKTADAIVVLTGGPSRISDAVARLASGHGQRLLISGVNPALSPADLKRVVAERTAYTDCCIDLGHKALNTRGNAIEAAEWTRSQRFRSLLVVTSAWHMPRALVELGRVLPEVELMAYPVVTTRMQANEWWRDSSTLKLLFKEYVKYMMAVAKIRPAPAVALTPQAPVAPRAAEARIAR